jgi:hypothetical protein
VLLNEERYIDQLNGFSSLENNPYICVQKNFGKGGKDTSIGKQ